MHELSREDRITLRVAEHAIIWGRERVALITSKKDALTDAEDRELSESAIIELSNSHDLGVSSHRDKPVPQIAIDEIDTEISDAAARLQVEEVASNER